MSPSMQAERTPGNMAKRRSAPTILVEKFPTPGGPQK